MADPWGGEPKYDWLMMDDPPFFTIEGVRVGVGLKLIGFALP